MLQKIKTVIKHPFAQQFRDVRALGLAAFGVIVILVSWSGVKAIQTNYGLQKQISQLEQQTQVQELENKNTKLGNQFLNTDEFLELAARRQFGLASPGETVIVVPKSVALAHTVDLPKPKQQAIAAGTTHEPGYQRNFQAWVNFFLHRTANNE